jgi:hypothetical protein
LGQQMTKLEQKLLELGYEKDMEKLLEVIGNE